MWMESGVFVSALFSGFFMSSIPDNSYYNA